MSTSSQSPVALSATPAFKQLAMAINPAIPADRASDLLYDFRTVVRVATLNEAIGVARHEYLTDGTGTDEDRAYNQGVSDVIAAIGALLEGGAA